MAQKQSKGAFLGRLESIKPKVWQLISSYLPRRRPYAHYDMVREYPLRKGKYFRPGLLILGAELFGSTQESALLSAAAMQLSEEWLLVHDDIEDHSETRRRTATAMNPTLNVMHGDELAINAGDALHIIMWKVLGDAMRQLKEGQAWRLFQKMNNILLTTTEGQFLELDWIRKDRFNVSEKEYYEMIYRKAGYYTVTGPLELGGIVADASIKKIAQLKKWGIPFGLAFQIWDDVLNITEDGAVIGKEKGGDIMEGKRTLLLIHLLQNCSSREKSYIKQVYRKKREAKTKEEVSSIIDLMHRHGSIAYATRAAEKYAESAERNLARHGKDLISTEAKTCISEGIRFVVTRRR